MYQTQTARPNILKTAVAGARKLLGGVTAAITGAFRDGSGERMELALDHLRTLTPPPVPAPTHEDRVADLIDAYADRTLHPDCEKIVRAIARKAYRLGFCYATQEKIGTWIGLSKSTVQLRIEQMEQRDLIKVIPRPGTSNLTILAEGTQEALRVKKLKKISQRERTNPITKRIFSAPTTEKLDEIIIGSPKKVDSWSKNTPCSQSRSTRDYINRERHDIEESPPSSDIYIKSSSRAREEKTVEKPVDKSRKTQPARHDNHPKNAQTPLPKRESSPHTTSQNGKEEKKKATGTSVSSHRERVTKTTALLVAEGVGSTRAREFAQTFDAERIRRTIALGLHREKRNPAGYLLRLIQDNAAAKHPVPGSEAERVRRQERPRPVLRGHIGPTEAAEAREPVTPAYMPLQPEPHAPRPVSRPFSGGSESPAEVNDPLAAFAPEARAVYVARAREEVFRANTWLQGTAAVADGPLMRAMIRTQLRSMLATARTPWPRGVPSG